MGSRTVWKIETEENTGIHLYSHWGGGDKLRATAEALLRSKSRWEDETYFTRIFTSWIINDDWDSGTGFGLWSGPLDRDYFEESYEPVTVFPKQKKIKYGTFLYTYEEFLDFARQTV